MVIFLIQENSLHFDAFFKLTPSIITHLLSNQDI